MGRPTELATTRADGLRRGSTPRSARTNQHYKGDAMNECGCGEIQNVRAYVMTDRLWSEFFSIQDASGSQLRPETATACAVCVSDWQRYAGPLVAKQ